MPRLDDKPPEPGPEGQAGSPRPEVGLSPPTAGIFGQRRENQIPWSSDCHVKRNVHGGPFGVHTACSRRDLPAQAEQSGRPSGGMQGDPTPVPPLQRHGLEVTPSLPAPPAAPCA